jgi:hypothetical protein
MRLVKSILTDGRVSSSLTEGGLNKKPPDASLLHIYHPTLNFALLALFAALNLSVEADLTPCV